MKNRLTTPEGEGPGRRRIARLPRMAWRWLLPLPPFPPLPPFQRRPGLRQPLWVPPLTALTALLLLGAGPATGQNTLVLGGGGSRGVAHAGALVGLERRGYGFDRVVGVSMGAVVGSLYASGMEPDRIWRIMEEEDWRAIFDPQPVRTGPSSWMGYPVFRMELPPDEPRIGGLVSDVRINLVLVRLLFDAEARAAGDFDRLPRAFRAVAARLSDGEPEVFASGSLARAVRASMAVPGFFPPVVAGGEIYVDGGVADYLPVGIARRLGPGEVVAVDVLEPPADRRPTSLLESATRSLRLLLRSARSERAEPDVRVVPALPPELSGAIFAVDPRPVLEAGLAAALDAPARPEGPTRPRPLPPPSRLDGLRVVAPAAQQPFLRRALEDRLGPYDPDAVVRTTEALYATGLFSEVWPGVEPDGERSVLRVEAEPSPPLLLVGAAAYDRDRGAGGWGRLRTWAPAGPVAVEASLSGLLHRLHRWAALEARVTPASALSWSAGIGGRAERRYGRPGDEPDSVVGAVLRRGAWVGLERRFSGGWVADLRAVADHVRVEAEGGSAPGEDGSAAGARLLVAPAEPLVQPVGIPVRLEAESLGGSAGHWRVRLGGSLPAELRALRLAPLLDVVAADPDAPVDVRPALGDEHLVPGLRFQERRGAARIVAGLDLALPAPFQATARLLTRAGAVGDDLGDAIGSRWLAGSEIGLQWWTPYGPLEVGWGVDTDGDSRFRLAVGPVF